MAKKAPLLKKQLTKIGTYKGVDIYAGDRGVTSRSQSSKPWLKDSVNPLLSVVYGLGHKVCGFSTSPWTDTNTLLEIAREEIDNWKPKMESRAL